MSPRRRRPAWARLSDEELLDLRLKDLGLAVEGTALEARVERLYAELERRGLRFRPHVWLSSDWFSPDGVPGFAIPFYLAHPRLMRLERKMMLEVEGGTEEQCMRLMRHETGHAIDTAYRLHRRKRWRELFGRYSQPYEPTYEPKPYSKSYVLHLDMWYAQSHPAEDFAETFAVWLRPRADWRKRYAGWRALRKLEYVDELMEEVSDRPQPVRSRERTEALRTLGTTLREHYEAKREKYGTDVPEFYDRDLRKLFPAPEELDGPAARGERAGTFLRRHRRHLRRVVARWTGEYRYTIDQVLGEMIDRADALGLRRFRSDEDTLADATVLVTVQTMNHLHGGHHKLVR